MASTENNAAYVSVGKPNVSGAVYWAPSGTSLPESASESLADAFVCLGYVSEDGVVNNNSPESDGIKAWGGATVCTIQTDRPDSFGLTLLESLNTDVLTAIYGSSNVSTDSNTGDTVVKATADEMDEASWVIDMVMKGDRAKRIVIPAGTITELAEISYKDDTAVAYGITITDVPDEDGVYHYEYIAAATASI